MATALAVMAIGDLLVAFIMHSAVRVASAQRDEGSDIFEGFGRVPRNLRRWPSSDRRTEDEPMQAGTSEAVVRLDAYPERRRGGEARRKAMNLIATVLYDLPVAVARRLWWLAPLLARVTVGWVFVTTGWGKLHNLQKIIDYFTELGIPYPQLQAPF